MHFVVSCPALKHIRCKHIFAVPSLDNSELTTFRNVTMYYSPRDVAMHAPRVGHFLADMWYERWKLLSENDSKVAFAPHYP